MTLRKLYNNGICLTIDCDEVNKKYTLWLVQGYVPSSVRLCHHNILGTGGSQLFDQVFL